MDNLIALVKYFCSIARKRLSVPKIVSALKRRETAFKTNMLRAVEFFAVCLFNLELLIYFLLVPFYHLTILHMMYTHLFLF